MIEIIPAIDIIDGKCVRLSKGDYDSKKIYNENPVEVAKEFEAYGIRRLHVVDLDGAKSKHIVNYRILEQLAGRTSLIIDFGGGIKSDEDLIIAFDNGAQMVTVGSIAVKNPQLFEKWLNKYGHEQIILGADVKDNKIAINGMLEGPSIEIYKNIMANHPDMHLIASGGVSCLDDIYRLDEAGIPAVVFGKAIYEGKIKLKDLSDLSNSDKQD